MEVPGIEPVTSWLVVRHADPKNNEVVESYINIKGKPGKLKQSKSSKEGKSAKPTWLCRHHCSGENPVKRLSKCVKWWCFICAFHPETSSFSSLIHIFTSWYWVITRCWCSSRSSAGGFSGVCAGCLGRSRSSRRHSGGRRGGGAGCGSLLLQLMRATVLAESCILRGWSKKFLT